MSERLRQKRMLALARLARAASRRGAACSKAWGRVQAAFERTLATDLELEAMVLRSLARVGEAAVSTQGLELHEALHGVLQGDRDFRGHLAVTALLLDELVRFERHELAAAKARLLPAPVGAAA